MRRGRTPYRLAQYRRWRSQRYITRHIEPHCDSVGVGLEVFGAAHVQIDGPNIHFGKHVHLQAFAGAPSRLATYTQPADDDTPERSGTIKVEDYALLMPGLTMIAAKSITIGANTMLANGCYVSDADWHGIYNRITPPGAAAAIVLEDNVWLGQGCKVGKGVTIGANTVVASGSIVTRSLPPNVIAAGAPAQPIRELSTKRRFRKRREMFEVENYAARQRFLFWLAHKDNGWWQWLRSTLRPSQQD